MSLHAVALFNESINVYSVYTHSIGHHTLGNIVASNTRQQCCCNNVAQCMFKCYLLQATSNMLPENRVGPYFWQHVPEKIKGIIKATIH